MISLLLDSQYTKIFLILEVHKWALEINQPFLTTLHSALLAAGYYGLLRVGELTQGPHCILAKNVHVGVKKKKLLIILRSSKTHCEGDKPQRIKISSNPAKTKNVQSRIQNFCPFQLIQEYVNIWPNAIGVKEQFFVFSDRSPVKPVHMRTTLKLLLDRLRIDSQLYSMHSLHIGRAGESLKYGLSVETIKKIGRWKWNAVFTYLHD